MGVCDTIKRFYVHGSVHRGSMSIIVQRDTTIYRFIIFSAGSSTCFGWYPHPSSGAHSKCNYNIWYWSNRNCYRPLTWRIRNVVPNPPLQRFPDDGWEYHPKHVELSTENTIKLYIVASCWTIIDIENLKFASYSIHTDYESGFLNCGIQPVLLFW